MADAQGSVHALRILSLREECFKFLDDNYDAYYNMKGMPYWTLKNRYMDGWVGYPEVYFSIIDYLNEKLKIDIEMKCSFSLHAEIYDWSEQKLGYRTKQLETLQKTYKDAKVKF